jgi:1,4-dihydroxy-2-naphthoate octaprenyltransferase
MIKFQNCGSSYSFSFMLFFALQLTLHRIYLIMLLCFGLLVKEKRWVVFKGEHDPTSIPGISFMVAINQLLKLLARCPYLLINTCDS